MSRSRRLASSNSFLTFRVFAECSCLVIKYSRRGWVNESSVCFFSLLGGTVSLHAPLGKTFALLVPAPAARDQPASFPATVEVASLKP